MSTRRLHLVCSCAAGRLGGQREGRGGGGLMVVQYVLTKGKEKHGGRKSACSKDVSTPRCSIHVALSLLRGILSINGREAKAGKKCTFKCSCNSDAWQKKRKETLLNMPAFTPHFSTIFKALSLYSCTTFARSLLHFLCWVFPFFSLLSVIPYTLISFPFFVYAYPIFSSNLSLYLYPPLSPLHGHQT